MPKTKKFKSTSKPAPKKKRKPNKSRAVPDLVTGRYVIVDKAGEHIFFVDEMRFTGDLTKATTFPGKPHARAALAEIVDELDTELLKEDFPEGDTSNLRALIEALGTATIEPFKVFASMFYSFDSSAKLIAAVVPWNAGQKISQAINEAKVDHIGLVKLSINALEEFKKSIKPEEKKIREDLESVQAEAERRYKASLRAAQKWAADETKHINKQLHDFIKSNRPKERQLQKDVNTAVKDLESLNKKLSRYAK